MVGTRATIEADKEIEELKKRNRDLEQQIDIIKYDPEFIKHQLGFIVD